MLHCHGRDLSTVFPVSAASTADGHLTIGGCDAVDLVRQYGSPLYVFDEATLRAQCGAFRDEFSKRYPTVRVLYASKAYTGLALLKIVHSEGLGLDVVSGGELAFARAAGFPVGLIYFHGNNKTPFELAEAVASGIGRIVVDNFHEIEILSKIASELGLNQEVLLRLSPGVDPHTHAKTTTGIIDSKFGFTIPNGQAAEALKLATTSPGLRVVGVHAHLGSPLFEIDPYQDGVDVMLDFVAEHKDLPGFHFEEFSPGGGFAIQYLLDTPPPPISEYAERIVNHLISGLDSRGLGRPRLVIEPGRSTVGRAGVALYTVGARKVIPGVRTYVSVDGGMADNIRPALYDSRYEVVVANRLGDPPSETITLAGKYCESGDILAKDVTVPTLHDGDLIAMPAAGAYAPAMASNYNASLKPAIVMVTDGEARIVRRRETYDDLLRCEIGS